MMQNQRLQLIKNRSFIVGTVNEAGLFSISTNPVGHETLEAAQTEADRLAGIFPGKAFFIAKFMGGSLVATTTRL